MEQLSKRIDDLNELVVRLDRRLPLIENAIESQNAMLRSRPLDMAEVREQLQGLQEELVDTQRQVELLRREFAPAEVVPRTGISA
jgi:chromosome segregation ATPase